MKIIDLTLRYESEEGHLLELFVDRSRLDALIVEERPTMARSESGYSIPIQRNFTATFKIKFSSAELRQHEIKAQ